MENKVKILLILFLVIIGAIGGYFAFTSYQNMEFDNAIIEAHGHYGTGEELFKSMRLNNQSVFSEGSPTTVRMVEEDIKYTNEIINSINKEISTLEMAKSFANTDEKKEYVDLIKKQREYSLDYFKGTSNWNDINLLYGKGEIGFFEMQNKRRVLKNDTITPALTNKEDSYYSLREFLVTNPEFSKILRNELGLSGTYIGERGDELKDFKYLDTKWW